MVSQMTRWTRCGSGSEVSTPGTGSALSDAGRSNEASADGAEPLPRLFQKGAASKLPMVYLAVWS